MVQAAFKESGTKYIEWAAKMAIGLKTGVPWIMCKQTNAPQEVVSHCVICKNLTGNGMSMFQINS